MGEIDEKTALKELEKGYGKARQLLQDPDKVERFLQRLESKLRTIPHVGEILARLPILASLINSYVKKEYTDIPLGSVIAVVSALLYVVSPVDILPDIIPGVGYIDDAFVIAACWKLVEADVDEYVQWRKNSGRVM